MLKRYKFLNTALLLGMLMVSSCEKGLDTIKLDGVVYIPNSGLSTQTALLGESIFKLGVYRAGVNQENSVTVNLDVDQDAFAEFQTDNPGYEILPTSNYSIPSGTVVIGGGNEREDLNIRLANINENTFVGKKYVLPISIKNVNPNTKINQEKKIAFLYFSRFRNAYEAKYKAYGTVKSDGVSVLKIDEVQSPVSVSANVLEVAGPVPLLKLRLTILNDKVQITGAPGSEAYAVQNDPKEESTFIGQFDTVYQTYKGDFKLFYTYLSNGKVQQAEVDLTFTL
ncbi:DUF1735 domain-containing protein [Pedobacter sp. ASV1-7]|uniref:DUF1735 domain-containing protein n=1 Tax=Pedobacter sp. ASV1-7 TaxID=3145237 RepID=UPI0032E87F99